LVIYVIQKTLIGLQMWNIIIRHQCEFF
jgi:hypothetical protein